MLFLKAWAEIVNDISHQEERGSNSISRLIPYSMPVGTGSPKTEEERSVHTTRHVMLLERRCGSCVHRHDKIMERASEGCLSGHLLYWPHLMPVQYTEDLTCEDDGRTFGPIPIVTASIIFRITSDQGTVENQR